MTTEEAIKVLNELDEITHYKKEAEATYVLNSWGINEGFVVFSIKEAADDNKEDQIQELKDLKIMLRNKAGG